MDTINLTKGKQAFINSVDSKLVRKYKWHYGRTPRGSEFAAAFIKGKIVRMHRLITGAKDGMEVDHINHNSLDNRRENLRVCTPEQNNFNRRKRKDSKYQYKGVRKKDNKWEAYIKLKGEQHYLGLFSTEIEAARAYNIKAKELFGGFANLNKV